MMRLGQGRRGPPRRQAAEAEDVRLPQVDGIPADQLPLIFEAFFSTGRQLGGTGLGLYIIKGIIEQKMGGTITVRSPGADQRGVCFTIFLPELKLIPLAHSQA